MDGSNLVWFFVLGFGLAYIIRRVFDTLDVATRQNALDEAEARRLRRINELYGRKNEEDK